MGVVLGELDESTNQFTAREEQSDVANLILSRGLFRELFRGDRLSGLLPRVESLVQVIKLRKRG